jgi:hypothetical protein
MYNKVMQAARTPFAYPWRVGIERSLLVLLLAVLTGLVLLQANPASNPPSRDGGIFLYGGGEILRGKLLYVDLVDNKPPGIYFLNALALFLAGGSRWGIWLFEFLFIFGSALLVHGLLKRQWGRFAALLGTLFWFSGLKSSLFGGNYTEEYSLLFNLLALVLFWRALKKPANGINYFLIGLTGGMSLLFRPNNIGVQLSMGVAILLTGILHRHSWAAIKRLSLAGIGMILPLGVFMIYFATRGGLAAMLKAVFEYNFTYTGSHLNLASTLTESAILLNASLIVSLAGMIGLITTAVRHGIKALNPWQWLLLVGLPMEFFLSALSGRAYNHYFICWLPMIALLCGLVFHFVWQKVHQWLHGPPGLVYGILLVTALIVTWHGQGIYLQLAVDLASGKKPVEFLDPISTYILQHTNPQDEVFIWGGQAGMNFTSRRAAPTAYFLYPMFVPSDLSGQLDQSFLSELQARPPELIVDAYYFATGDEIWPSLDPLIRTDQLNEINSTSRVFWASNIEQVFDFINQNYHLEKKIALASIYRLNPK